LDDRYRLPAGSTVPPPELADPVAGSLPAEGAVLAQLSDLIAAAPAPRRALDHVAATPETALRRAAYLRTRFALDGATLLCVGDHDLTSLAATLLCPGLSTVVVDVDDRLLEHIDAAATRLRLPVTCRWADLRLGLPPEVRGDVAFTDPPYTPDGVALFAGRAFEALADRRTGRVLLAYGTGETQPALGWKVQAALSDLGAYVEAMLPDFNRYAGAEAIGSASDLYVLRPTPRTYQVLDRRLAAVPDTLYTHGPQSAEAATAPDVPGSTPLAGWLAEPHSAPEVTVVATGPGSLLQVLLAGGAERITAVVDNNSDDVRDEAGQRALQDLVGAAYRLRYRRNQPDTRHATVEATRVPDGGSLARYLLDRAHGKVTNTLREGLVATGRAATRNEARALVPAAYAGARLLDLPRHQLRQLLAASDAAT
jgi:N4-bis(aminopropyl)spermidine synthase